MTSLTALLDAGDLIPVEPDLAVCAHLRERCERTPDVLALLRSKVEPSPAQNHVLLSIVLEGARDPLAAALLRAGYRTALEAYSAVWTYQHLLDAARSDEQPAGAHDEVFAEVQWLFDLALEAEEDTTLPVTDDDVDQGARLIAQMCAVYDEQDRSSLPA